MGWRKATTDLVIDGAKFVGEQVFHLFRGGDAVNTTLTKRETIAATGNKASADVYARQHGDDGSVVKMRVTTKNPAVFEQQHTTIDALEDQYKLDADDAATLRQRHGDGQIDLRDLSEDDVFIGVLKARGVDLLMHPQPTNSPKMHDPAFGSRKEAEVTYQIFDHNQIDNVERITPFHVSESGFFSPARRAVEEMDQPRATGQAFIKAILKHKGGSADAKQTGMLEILEARRDGQWDREEVLALMDLYKHTLEEVNLGGPKDLHDVRGIDIDEAYMDFTNELDPVTPDADSVFGRDEINFQRESLDEDQAYFMDDFMEYVRDNSDGTSQGIDEETAVRLFWDDWADTRAQDTYLNSGIVRSSWTPDGSRHQYSINGSTEEGYFNAEVHILFGPQTGRTRSQEFSEVEDAQQWLFDQARDNDDVFYDMGEGGINEGYTDLTIPGVENHQEIRLMLPKGSNRGGGQDYYARPHYAEANIIAHSRFGYRDSADSGPTLHIDEIQSDWHQTGETHGYIGPVPPGGFPGTSDEIAKLNRMVPDAPFKKNWYELMFKRILTEAVRDPLVGRVSWTTGAQQMQRYPASVRHLSHVEVTREVITSRQFESTVPLYEVVVVDVNGKTEHKVHVPEAELHELMGKDLAADVVKVSHTWDVGEAQSYGDLRGLQVGLKGLTNLYDNKLPQYVAKLCKKYGVKPKLSGNPYRVVEVTQTGKSFGTATTGPTEIKVTVFEVVSGEGADKKFHGEFTNKNMAEQMIRENDNRVWYIDITPEMREDIIKQGLPLTFEEHKTSGRYV